jgi:L-malate glycosyltransferase
MIRVLLLSNGASIHTIRWANSIAARPGHEVHLVTQQPASEELSSSVAVHAAPVRGDLGYFVNASFVRRAVHEIRPDLMHAHYVSGYGTLARLSRFKPLVLSVWGADIYDFPVKSKIHSWLIRRNLSSANWVLSTSHAMATEIAKYTTNQVYVTPFGVDLEQFHPRKVESIFGHDDIVIGTVKTLEKKYGVEFLLRAFSLLRNKHARLPLKLLIVGGGSQEAFLKRLACELGISNDTVFAGAVSHAEVPRYQNMLSISVSLSVMDSESFGVAVIEASACGKPVVVTDVGGLPEVVENGVTGFVVEPRNPMQAADAIETLVLDKLLCKRMGEAGLKRVRNLYDWNNNVSTMLDIYNRVAAENTVR